MNIRSRSVRVILLVAPLAAAGCTHHQLRFNTVNQAHTVADVHTQQVLDNLAKFAHNSDALPHFSWPNQGSSSVNDGINGNVGFNFNPFGLTSWLFGTSGSRSFSEAYTMTPISDVRKLELMRCVYQRAISTCCSWGEAERCPNCEARFNKFYLGSEQVAKTGAETVNGNALYRVKRKTALYYRDGPGRYAALAKSRSDDDYYKVFADVNELNQTTYRLTKEAKGADNRSVPDGTLVFSNITGGALKPKTHMDRLYVDNTLDVHTERTGKVTAECLFSPCWFVVGSKRDVPCGIHPRLVGHCGRTCIWVPEEGRDQLTKLTLTILDIALNDPPKPKPTATKEVVTYLDSHNRLSNRAAASYKITATIPVSDSHTSVIPGIAEQQKQQALQAMSRADALFKSTVATLAADAAALLEFQRQFPADEQLNLDDPATKESLTLADRVSAERPETGTFRKLPLKVRRVFDAAEEIRAARSDLRAAASSARTIIDRPPPVEMQDPQRTPVPGAGYLQFNQNLRALTPRS